MPRNHKNSSGDDDTIVAVITPPGEGGIAALRLCGPRSLNILNRFFKPAYHRNKKFTPFLLRYGYFAIDDNSAIDEITAVYMPEGDSYTGLEQVEIFCHGGRLVVKKILDELITGGARPAAPGEFTRLAFLNGRIRLSPRRGGRRYYRRQYRFVLPGLPGTPARSLFASYREPSETAGRSHG